MIISENDNSQLVLLTKDNYQTYQKAINQFRCSRLPSGVQFLKDCKKLLEWGTDDRIYLIIDKRNNRLMAFFALKAFAIFFFPYNPFSPVSYPAIKLNWFLVSDTYSKDTETGRGIRTGHWIFTNYLIPTVIMIRDYIGITYMILFSIPEPKVIKAYERMGFHRVLNEQEKEDLDVAEYIQCPYEKNCKLLIYNLRSPINVIRPKIEHLDT